MKRSAIFSAVLFIMLIAVPVHAIDFFFVPDTVSGSIGDTVLLTGAIGPSDTLRGFTIYMYYDTNSVDLVPPPVPGSLIANRQGLDFRYADHIPSAPTRLEVGATVFSTDYWAGPGELFHARFVLRECGNLSMTADVGFRRPDASFIQGVFHPPVINVCVAPPQPATGLTIAYNNASSVILRWRAVHADSLGNPLPNPPDYLLYRQQFVPSQLPPVLVTTVPDTFYVDPFQSGVMYIYYVIAQSSP